MYPVFFGSLISSPKPVNRIAACFTPGNDAKSVTACCVVFPAIRCLICSWAVRESPYTHVALAWNDKNTRGCGELVTLACFTETWTVPNKLYPAPVFCSAWVERNVVAFCTNSPLLYAAALHVSDTVTFTCVASSSGW